MICGTAEALEEIMRLRALNSDLLMALKEVEVSLKHRPELIEPNRMLEHALFIVRDAIVKAERKS